MDRPKTIDNKKQQVAPLADNKHANRNDNGIPNNAPASKFWKKEIVQLFKAIGYFDDGVRKIKACFATLSKTISTSNRMVWSAIND